MGDDAPTVRPAAARDASSVARLLAEGSLTPEAEDVAAPQAYASAIERIRRTGGEVLVAELGDTVVGVCEVVVLEHLQHRGGRVAELESVHVDAAHRGNGIGASLLRAAEAWARERGCHRLQLTSNRSRADAHRFYEANGYVASHVGFKRVLGT